MEQESVVDPYNTCIDHKSVKNHGGLDRNNHEAELGSVLHTELGPEGNTVVFKSHAEKTTTQKSYVGGLWARPFCDWLLDPELFLFFSPLLSPHGLCLLPPVVSL